MSRQSGEFVATCPACAQKYRHTNWMKRVVLRGGRKIATDTHLLACEAKANERKTK